MKSLQELFNFCIDWKKSCTDDLVSSIADNDAFDNGYSKGRIDTYDFIAGEIRRALKYHECEFNDKVCLMCGGSNLTNKEHKVII